MSDVKVDAVPVAAGAVAAAKPAIGPHIVELAKYVNAGNYALMNSGKKAIKPMFDVMAGIVVERLKVRYGCLHAAWPADDQPQLAAGQYVVEFDPKARTQMLIVFRMLCTAGREAKLDDSADLTAAAATAKSLEKDLFVWLAAIASDKRLNPGGTWSDAWTSATSDMPDELDNVAMEFKESDVAPTVDEYEFGKVGIVMVMSAAARLLIELLGSRIDRRLTEPATKAESIAIDSDDLNSCFRLMAAGKARYQFFTTIELGAREYAAAKSHWDKNKPPKAPKPVKAPKPAKAPKAPAKARR